MKVRFSLNRFLHNDKLVLIASVIIAIIVVVFGPGATIETEIQGVPINIITNEHLENLRLTAGGDTTVTVKVKGPRSVVGRLSPQDIAVTANAYDIDKSGSHKVELTTPTTYNYSITQLVSSDGGGTSVNLTFVEWDQQPKPIEANVKKLSVKDAEKQMIGNGKLGGLAILSGNKVLVSGPRVDVEKVTKVVATVSGKQVLTKTAVLDAELVAYDKNNKPVVSVTFPDAEDGIVSVTVPVLTHYSVELKPTLLNAPTGYKPDALATVSPSEIHFACEAEKKDAFLGKIQEKLTVDFDQLKSNDLRRTVKIEEEEGVRMDSLSVVLTLNMKGLKARTVKVPLSQKNVEFTNIPEGYTCEVNQKQLTDIRIYGPSTLLEKIDPKDIKVVVDMSGKTTNVKDQMVTARLVLPDEYCWIYYGAEKAAVEIQIKVTNK